MNVSNKLHNILTIMQMAHIFKYLIKCNLKFILFLNIKYFTNLIENDTA